MTKVEKLKKTVILTQIGMTVSIEFLDYKKTPLLSAMTFSKNS